LHFIIDDVLMLSVLAILLLDLDGSNIHPSLHFIGDLVVDDIVPTKHLSLMKAKFVYLHNLLEMIEVVIKGEC